jgi:hypothetical protein
MADCSLLSVGRGTDFRVHLEESYEAILEAERLQPRSLRIKDSLVALAQEAEACEAAGRHAQVALEMGGEASNILSAVAEYELDCNASAERANELMKKVKLERR